MCWRSIILIGVCLSGAVSSFYAIAGNANVGEYTTRTVKLDDDDFDRDRVGRLEWRGGFEITSMDSRFGGLSGLYINPKGQRLTAVSDRGYWFHAGLRYKNGHLIGLSQPKLSILKDRRGKPVKGVTADAESIATRDDQSMLVSFERRHRVWSYTSATSSPTQLSTPKRLRSLSNNGGVEAMTYTCENRLLLVAEKNKTRDTHVQGWLQNGQDWDSFTYNTIAGYRPTGATTLPDCRIMFLERSFSLIAGVSIRVTIVNPTQLLAGASITAQEIARFEFPVIVDNFEGIAARQSESGETLVYILSDDNYNPLQRTLLLMFEYTASRS
jgi:hypothetical protein